MTIRRSHSLIGLLLAVTRLHQHANAAATVEYAKECLLPCRNGGVCLNHHPENAIGDSDPRVPLIPEEDRPKHPYCHCPTGYTGTFCDVQFLLCDSPKEICSNGETCARAVDDDEEEFYHCECNPLTTDFNSITNLGLCQRASTVFCIKELTHFDANATVDESEERSNTTTPKQPTSAAPDIHSNSFCVNGGTCVKVVESGANHGGCNCPEHWAGPHCEQSTLEDGTYNLPQQVEYRKFRMTLAAISITIALALFGALGYFAYEGSDWAHAARRRRRRRRRLRARRQRQREQQPEQEMVPHAGGSEEEEEEEEEMVDENGDRSGEESGTSGKTTESTTTASYR